MDVKTLCLGVLTLGDSTGYEIRKQFEEGPFSHFFDASYGSIYPALGRLLDEGLVSVTETPQEGKPDKKVYSLTPVGLDAFRKALAEPPGPDKIRSEVLVRFFFAEFMERRDLEAIYDSYLAEFQQKVDHICCLDPEGVPEGRLFVRRLGLAFYQALADFLVANRDRLLDRDAFDERDATQPIELKRAGIDR